MLRSANSSGGSINLKTGPSDWSSWSVCSCEGNRSRTRTLDPPEATTHQPLLETQTCTPIEKIWYGDTRLATISTNAGVHESCNGAGSCKLSHMFDNDPHTLWHSDKHSYGIEKILTIDFKVSLYNTAPNERTFRIQFISID